MNPWTDNIRIRRMPILVGGPDTDTEKVIVDKHEAMKSLETPKKV